MLDSDAVRMRSFRYFLMENLFITYAYDNNQFDSIYE